MRVSAGVVVSTLVAALVASQRRDIVRYLRIKQMSPGQGHPEYVPVTPVGRAAYPDD
jgi:hypothetical protein